MQIIDMPDIITNFIFIVLICFFVLGLCNLFRSVQAKQTRYIVISVTLLLIEYFLLQIISDILNGNAGMEHVEVSYILGHMNVIWWIILLVIIMVISITLASFFKHWKKNHITPMSVKDSIDMLHAGLCYWEKGGRIILSNKKMDEICLAVSGEMLLNGDRFHKCIDSECMSMPDGTTKYFFHNLVEFEDKQIHELIAVDVTELYKKNELLEEETISLQKMNENLRRYNQEIEETVRKQEILDTKIYIHDEMNRLMLLTTAMTENSISEEEFYSVLTLWRNNAILLGNEVEKNKKDTEILEINKLAELLGINIVWVGKSLYEIPKKHQEILIMVIREAIANAVKHAEAKNVKVNIENVSGGVTAAVSNDGKKPSRNVSLGGGLSNIRRMVEAQRGSLKVVVKEQFTLVIHLP